MSKFGKVWRMIEQLWKMIFVVDFRSLSRFYFAILLELPNIIKTGKFFANFKMHNHLSIFKVFNKKIILNGLAFGYAAEIYIRKCYFLPKNFRIGSKDVVMDLGAAMGVFTVLASLIADKVLAVELLERNIEELNKNLELNQQKNKVSVISGAVGYNSGWLSKNLKEFGNFRRLEMNSIFEDFKVEKIDFLKIDIEGSEFDLFSRDIDWLDRVEKIAMEVHPEFGDVNNLVEILNKNRFISTLFDVGGKRLAFPVGEPHYVFAERIKN